MSPPILVDGKIINRVRRASPGEVVKVDGDPARAIVHVTAPVTAEIINNTPKKYIDLLVALYALGEATQKEINEFLDRRPDTQINALTTLVNIGWVIRSNSESREFAQGRAPYVFKLNARYRQAAGLFHAAFRELEECERESF